MQGVLSILAGSYDLVEGDGDGASRVFTWRREDATEATVRERALFISLLTLLERH
jgi:hypothetical protein